MDAKKPSGPAGPQTESLRPCHVGYIYEGKTCEGYTFDFSETGMLVLCQDPPPLQTKLNLQPGISQLTCGSGSARGSGMEQSARPQ